MIDELLQQHEVAAKWVKGHAGHPENERCDELATAEAVRIAGRPPAYDRRSEGGEDLFG